MMPNRRIETRHRASVIRGVPRRRGVAAVLAAGVLALFALARGVRADTFAKVSYDPGQDELVVEMHYRGTNAQHHFSLQWGDCQPSTDGPVSAIDVEVLDDQWQDGEQADYSTTTRFSLAGFDCRPAQVTLHTAPRFYTTVFVPAAPH